MSGAKFSFEIEGKLPGLNEIIRACRASRFTGAKQKKDCDEICGFGILAGNVPVFVGPVQVQFDWYSGDQRRDPDNIRAGSKFILDALVGLGKLSNDNAKTIKGISDRFLVDKGRPRVVVTISSVDDVVSAGL